MGGLVDEFDILFFISRGCSSFLIVFFYFKIEIKKNVYLESFSILMGLIKIDFNWS